MKSPSTTGRAFKGVASVVQPAQDRKGTAQQQHHRAFLWDNRSVLLDTLLYYLIGSALLRQDVLRPVQLPPKWNGHLSLN